MVIVWTIMDVKRLPTRAAIWEDVHPRGVELNNDIMADLYLDIDNVTLGLTGI